LATRIGRWWTRLSRPWKALAWLVFLWIWLGLMLAMLDVSANAPKDQGIRGLFLLVLLSPLIAFGLSRRGQP
jgi:hypothetical protein